MVVSSAELEARLEPVYEALHLAPGQLEALTGIVERRWWEQGYRLSDGAIAAARHALEAADVRRRPGRRPDLRRASAASYFEPATACRVAAGARRQPRTPRSTT